MNFSNKSLVYILTDETHSTLRTGYSNNFVKKYRDYLKQETSQKAKTVSATKLVYYEVFDKISSAIMRERAIQEWEMRQKINLVNNINPEWEDLTPEIIK